MGGIGEYGGHRGVWGGIGEYGGHRGVWGA